MSRRSSGEGLKEEEQPRLTTFCTARSSIQTRSYAVSEFSTQRGRRERTCRPRGSSWAGRASESFTV